MAFQELVDSLSVSKKIQASFLAVDRAQFVASIYINKAHTNDAIPIGTLHSTPKVSTISTMLSLLNVNENNRILEIGTGSGYVTALLYKLACPAQVSEAYDGKIITLERSKKLCAFAQHNLKKSFAHALETKQIQIFHEDAAHSLDLFGEGYFDRILCTAGVKDEKDFPLEAYIQLLRKDGLLLFPTMKGELLLYTKSLRNKPFLLHTEQSEPFCELKHGKTNL